VCAPSSKQRQEIESGQLRATAVGSPPLERTLLLCAASHIPPSAASQAVERLALALVHVLCKSGEWLGAKELSAKP